MIQATGENVGRFLRSFPIEAACWLTGLLLLALSSPGAYHFSLCPLQNAGMTFCPGCGLGRSITLLFRGDFTASFEMHPLGIFALIVLSFRIVALIKHYLKYYGQSY